MINQSKSNKNFYNHNKKNRNKKNKNKNMDQRSRELENKLKKENYSMMIQDKEIKRQVNSHRITA